MYNKQKHFSTLFVWNTVANSQFRTLIIIDMHKNLVVCILLHACLTAHG